MPGVGDDPSDAIEELVEAFEKRWSDAVAFGSDRALAPEIASEARPAIHALHFALAMENTDDEGSLDHHEGLAMVSLLGRRAALLGASPSALRRLVPALVEVFPSTPHAYAEHLADAALEGFVRGKEEALLAAAAENAAKSLVLFEAVPGVFVFVLAGEHDADALQARAEDIGRELFSREASACVIAMAHLEACTRSRAAAVLDVYESARLVGAYAVLTGATPGWRALFSELPVHDLELADTFYEGFERALSHTGSTLRPRFDARLRKLLGKRE